MYYATNAVAQPQYKLNKNESQEIIYGYKKSNNKKGEHNN